MSNGPPHNRTVVELRSVPIALSPRDAALAAHSPLPQPLTSLIGRDADAEEARALIIDGGVRLLTLTGAGGVGKTRLALLIGEVAAPAFADGVVFVPLAAIADPELVLSTIARALGLHELGSDSPHDLIADFLGERRLLLILDNFEQVSSAGAYLVPLLTRCPGVVLLVTSRALLGIAGEQRFLVAPLALPDLPAGARHAAAETPLAAIGASAAVQLFVARAQAIDPRFALSEENAPTIASICRRLDGLPLAIELAAARLRHFSPAELLARLRSTLPLLTGGPADAPDRLRTMRQAIAWSYDLLSPEEQSFFRRLAIFVGGCSLEAADWVAGEVGSRKPVVRRDDPLTPRLPDTSTPLALDAIASLIDKSLLQMADAGNGTRYGMLETIREFGLEQLAANDEEETIAARHAAWCVHLADRTRQSGAISQHTGLDLLELEQPNFRVALGWYLERGETVTAMHLAGQLSEFWTRHGHVAEAMAWLERVLAADDGPPTVARVGALVGLNMLLWQRDELARAEQLVNEAEQVARAVGDAGALAYARLHQGYVALFQGDFDVAQARGEESLASAQAIPQGFSHNGARWLLAATALARGDNDRAAEHYEHLLASARVVGDDISIANSHAGFATLAKRRGELGPALAGFAAAARVSREFGDRNHGSIFLDEAAAIAVELGAAEPAARLFAAAEAMRAAVGARRVSVAGDGNRSAEESLRWLELAKTALGREAFAAAWADGSALSLDEAIAELAALAEEIAQAPTTQLGDAVGLAKLTAREREILRLVINGQSDKEIAGALRISASTVSKHVASIRDKLNAPSRTAAATLALRSGRI